GGSPANLQIWRAVRLPIYIARDHRAPRFDRAVAFFVLARRAASFRLRKLRQSELPLYMIATRDRIVAGHAMRHETARRGAVALDRKRTIFGGVSRPRHERFALGYNTTERLGDVFNRGKVICWHDNGGVCARS